jgi:hypothetical protein
MVFNTTFKNISDISWRQFYWWRKPKYQEKTTRYSSFCNVEYWSEVAIGRDRVRKNMSMSYTQSLVMTDFQIFSCPHNWLTFKLYSLYIFLFSMLVMWIKKMFESQSGMWAKKCLKVSQLCGQKNVWKSVSYVGKKMFESQSVMWAKKCLKVSQLCGQENIWHFFAHIPDWLSNIFLIHITNIEKRKIYKLYTKHR